MSKSLKQLYKENSFQIKGGYRPQKIEHIHEHLQAMTSGTGVHRAKKGKGSYNRKAKHANTGFDE